MPLLTVSHLSLTLGGQQILHDIRLEAEAGEVVGLIGPNGSGKTTLFNILSGFLQPDSGTVHFHDHDITRLSPAKRARLGIGRVFQNFGIFREMTLRENVLVALESLSKEERFKLDDLHHAVHETLSMVGLEHHANKKANSRYDTGAVSNSHHKPLCSGGGVLFYAKKTRVKKAPLRAFGVRGAKTRMMTARSIAPERGGRIRPPRRPDLKFIEELFHLDLLMLEKLLFRATHPGTSSF